MILEVDDLKKRYKTYSNIKTKVAREVKNGKLIQLKKGVYTDDFSSPGYVFSNALLSPSYVSFETGLFIHGLISYESSVFYNASREKFRHKEFVNKKGKFVYQDIPTEVFNKGVFYHNENGYMFLLSSKEKALCDTLYKSDSILSTKRLKEYLFVELGLSEDSFWGLDFSLIFSWCPLYKSRTLNTLEAFARDHLGLPKPSKDTRKKKAKDSAAEAWEALAAFRNKYSEN